MAKGKEASSFDRLTYEAFEKIVRPRCHGYITIVNGANHRDRIKANMQTVDYFVFLRSGFTQEEWDKHFSFRSVQDMRHLLSNLRNNKFPMPAYILETYIDPDMEVSTDVETDVAKIETVYIRVRRHFDCHLSPLLRDIDRVTVTKELRGVIERDELLPSDIKDILLSTYINGDWLSFLSVSFIIAVTRNTYPDIKKVMRTPNEKFELLPRVEKVVLEMQKYQKSDSYIETLRWLVRESFRPLPELKHYHKRERLNWNAIAFWNATSEFICKEDLSEIDRKCYEYVKRMAYIVEYSDLQSYLVQTLKDLRKRYKLDYPLYIKYSEDKLDDGVFDGMLKTVDYGLFRYPTDIITPEELNVILKATAERKNQE